MTRLFGLFGMAFCLWIAPDLANAQPFTDILAPLQPMGDGDADWGDYDNDGDLDLLMAGGDSSGVYTKLYRNDAGTFTEIATGLPGANFASVAWGDYDSDGDLDILLTGKDGVLFYARVYRNDAGTFTDINANLLGVISGATAWGDYDNDGDLDILLSGDFGGFYIPITTIFQNDGGVFTDINPDLQELAYGSIAWGDYDNDGDLDILATGVDDGLVSAFTIVYENDEGDFSDIQAPLTGIFLGAAEWGDYDHDGDLDILLIGGDDNGRHAKIYRNDSGQFTEVTSGLAPVEGADAAWGDYDNDGDLDIAMAGFDGNAPVLARIYRNHAGAFTDINAGIAGVISGALAWGDYDHDGDLDLSIIGSTLMGYISKIYRNDCPLANTAPSAPTNLNATLLPADTAIRFTWSPSTDATTATPALSYRLWIGTAMNTLDVSAPMADTATGWRRIAAMGNIQGASWNLKQVTFGETYFACVSAIDAGFMGSPCSNTTSFLVGTPEQQGVAPQVIAAGPNPTQGIIHVALTSESRAINTHFQLTDVSGQSISGFAGEFDGQMDLDLSTLAAGVYLLQLDSPGNSKPVSLKIIKQ